MKLNKQLRLEKVKPMILQGQTSIEIAEKTGYGDSSIKRYRQDIKKDFLEVMQSGEQAKILEAILIDFNNSFIQAEHDLLELKDRANTQKLELDIINSLIKLTRDKIELLQTLSLLPKPQDNISIEIQPKYNLIDLSKYVEQKGEKND